MEDSENHSLLSPKVKSPILKYGSSALETIEEELDDINKEIKWYNRPSVVYIYTLFFLCTISTMVLPVKEAILFEKACNSNRRLDGTCDGVENQVLVSNLTQVGSVINQVCTFIGMSKIGKLSDTYGRKPLLIMIVFTLFLSSLITFTILSQFERLMFKSMILAGCSSYVLGGLTGVLSIGNAYLTDFISKEKLPLIMSFSLAAASIGISLGSFICKLLLELGRTLALDQRQINFLPFLGQMIILLVTLIFTTLIVESKQTFEKPERFSLIDSIKNFNINSIFNILEPIKILTVPDTLIAVDMKKYGKIIKLQVMTLMLALCSSTLVSSSIIILYLQYAVYNFHWESGELSTLVLVCSISSFACLSAIIPIISSYILPRAFKLKPNPKHLDRIDLFMLFFGNIVEVFVSFALAFSNSTNLTYGLFAVLGLDGGIPTTAFSSITKFFPEDKSAEVFIATNMVTTLVTCLGPVVMLQIYNFGLHHGMPKLPFFFMGIFLVCISMVLVLSKLVVDKEEIEEEEDQTIGQIQVQESH